MNATQLPAEIIKAKREAETLDRYEIHVGQNHAALWKWDRIGWQVAGIFASQHAAVEHLLAKLPAIPNTRADR